MPAATGAVPVDASPQGPGRAEIDGRPPRPTTSTSHIPRLLVPRDEGSDAESSPCDLR